MSLSDSYSYSEESSSQGSGCSADSPISLASSPASSASSCDTFLVHRTEELEADSDLDPGSGVAIANSSSSHVLGGTASISPADNGDRIRALMAKYEQVMSADGAQTRCASSDSPPNEGVDFASLSDSHSHDDRSDDKRTKTDIPQGNLTSPRTRRDKKVKSGARSRVQKKSATVSRHKAYTFERLGGARRAASGAIECEVHWAPTWLPLSHFEGDDAIREAKDLVVDLLGSDSWRNEARKLGLLLSPALSSL